MSISQNRKFIGQSAQDFFQNVMDSWQSVELDSHAAPIIHYLVPSLFMQLCGFVEQKCSCILWEIGYHNYHERYGLMGKQSIESIDHEKLKNLFIQIKDPSNKYTDEIKQKDEELKNLRKQDSAEAHLKKGQLTSEIQKLKVLYKYNNVVSDKYPTQSEYLIGYIKKHKLAQELAYLCHLHRKDIPDNKVNEATESSRQERNHIAHFYHFYKLSSIHSLMGMNTRYFNYLDGICLLLTIDEVFREACQNIC